MRFIFLPVKELFFKEQMRNTYSVCLCVMVGGRMALNRTDIATIKTVLHNFEGMSNSEITNLLDNWNNNNKKYVKEILTDSFKTIRKSKHFYTQIRKDTRKRRIDLRIRHVLTALI